jgi:hypothetical protein
MSEIEKMYINAGFQKKRYCEWDKEGTCFHDGSIPCNKCTVRREKTYPPFTTWQQLDMLCFIVNKKHSVVFHDNSFNSDKLTLEKVKEILAFEVNSLWQNLTEEEKQQVKGILG